ncbi:MAG: ATP-binding protein [Anaerolineales bacterium]|jgi:serine/threonine-protein kinase RsbW
MRTAIFPAAFDQLDAIRLFAGQAARDAGLEGSDIDAVELAVDEACSNIIEHAYQGMHGGDIECTCDLGQNSLTIALRDHGVPFDASALPFPDVTSNLAHRKLGGLGVYLIRTLMDEVRFEPLGKSGNVLTMTIRGKHPK